MAETLDQLIADKLHNTLINHTDSQHHYRQTVDGVLAGQQDRCFPAQKSYCKILLHRLGEPMVRHASTVRFQANLSPIVLRLNIWRSLTTVPGWLSHTRKPIPSIAREVQNNNQRNIILMLPDTIPNCWGPKKRSMRGRTVFHKLSALHPRFWLSQYLMHSMIVYPLWF